MAWTPELEAEYQALKGATAPKPVAASPSVAPSINSQIRANPAANQKLLEATAAKQAETNVEQGVQDQSRNQVFPALDEVEANLETLKTGGGLSPLYDNDELLFGTLPGVKPAIQFARSQGFAKGMGDNLSNREVYQSSVGSLASQVKNVIRKPGEGVWTDSDQQFLMQLLPSGAGYDTDKRILQGLRSGALLNKIQEYRRSSGLKAEDGGASPAPAAPVFNGGWSAKRIN